MFLSLLLIVFRLIKTNVSHPGRVVNEMDNTDYSINIQSEEHTNTSSHETVLETIENVSDGYEIRLKARRVNVKIDHTGKDLFIYVNRNTAHQKMRSKLKIEVKQNSIKNIRADEIEDNGEYFTIVKVSFENPDQAAVLKKESSFDMSGDYSNHN